MWGLRRKRERPTAAAPQRLGLFTTFYPNFQYAGNSGTGIATELSSCHRVSKLILFTQEGARLPTPNQPSTTQATLVPCWRHGDPLSLVRALLKMLSYRSEVDGYLFNVYVTSFGKSRLANAVGLANISLLRLLSRRPVLVYFHNLLETQEVEKLGYAPNRLTRLLVAALEYCALKLTTAVVPLESQASALEKKRGWKVARVLLPYIEMSYPARHATPERPEPHADEPLRVLLFGNWGPQKDLPGVVESLSKISAEHNGMQVTIAGGTNLNFPGHTAEVQSVLGNGHPPNFRFVGPVPEEGIIPLLYRADVLILPYRGTGGYSGAMNCAAVCQLPVIAYDLPQLRECASELDLPITFVKPRDPNQLLTALDWVRTRRSRRQYPTPEQVTSSLTATHRGVERLLDLLWSGEPHGAA